MPRPLLERLRGRGLLREDLAPEAAPPEGPAHLAVLRLCGQGALQGGLSVALDVRPDELLGPLCAVIGGGAKALRVLDVREAEALELRVRLGDLEERWEVEDLSALVHNLNDLFRDDRSARAAAVLGEWDDALQLWCVEKGHLAALLREDFFDPRNRAQLASLV